MRNLINQNKIFFGIIVFLILLTIPLTIIQVQTQQSLKQQAAASEMTIGFGNQSNYSVEINKVVNVGVTINNPDNRDISAVDLTLTYDSSKLTLNEFLPEGTFEPIINDNQPGTLHYVGANPKDDTTRTALITVLVGTLHFLAKDIPTTPVPSSNIGFTSSTQITVADQASSIFPSRLTATVTVVAAGTGPTATPTPTSFPGQTRLDMSFALSEIGNTGGRNNNPKNRKTIPAVLQLTNVITKAITESNAAFTYNPTGPNAELFTGTFNLDASITTGNYIVKVKPQRYLRKQIPGIVTIQSGTTNQISISKNTPLLYGDFNEINEISASFYGTYLVNCYENKVDKPSCPNKIIADLNDDGEVNGIDVNGFIKSLITRQGD